MTIIWNYLAVVGALIALLAGVLACWALQLWMAVVMARRNAEQESCRREAIAFRVLMDSAEAHVRGRKLTARQEAVRLALLSMGEGGTAEQARAVVLEAIFGKGEVK